MYKDVKVVRWGPKYRKRELSLMTLIEWGTTVQGTGHWVGVWNDCCLRNIDPSPRDRQYLYGALRSVGRDV